MEKAAVNTVAHGDLTTNDQLRLLIVISVVTQLTIFCVHVSLNSITLVQVGRPLLVGYVGPIVFIKTLLTFKLLLGDVQDQYVIIRINIVIALFKQSLILNCCRT